MRARIGSNISLCDSSEIIKSTTLTILTILTRRGLMIGSPVKKFSGSKPPRSRWGGWCCCCQAGPKSASKPTMSCVTWYERSCLNQGNSLYSVLGFLQHMVPEPSKKKKKQKLLKPPLNSEIKYWKGYPYHPLSYWSKSMVDLGSWWSGGSKAIPPRKPANVDARKPADPPLAKSLLERNSTWITSLRLEDWDQDPRPKSIPFPKIKQQLRNGQAVEGNATELWTCKEMDELSLLWKSLTTPPHWPLYDSERMAIYFWYFFAAGFGIIFGFLVLCFPASLLFCFSAFLLFCLSASLLYLFLFFSASLLSLLLCCFAFVLYLLLFFSASPLFCFCASVPFYFYYPTYSVLFFSHVFLLLCLLLLCFSASCLYCLFVFFFFCFILSCL